MSVRARVSSGDPVTSDISRSPQAPCPPTNSQVTALHHDLAAPLTCTRTTPPATSSSAACAPKANEVSPCSRPDGRRWAEFASALNESEPSSRQHLYSPTPNAQSVEKTLMSLV